MISVQVKLAAETDYYSLLEDVGAELVDSCLIYGQAAPSRVHQTILIVSSSNSSYNYIIKLKLYDDAGVREYWIVDSTKKKIFVYRLENTEFKVEVYPFKEKMKTNEKRLFKGNNFLFNGSIDVWKKPISKWIVPIKSRL